MKWIASLCILAPLACSNGEATDANIGYVEAEWLYVAAPSSGWLLESTVSEGDAVSVGDVLFRLDDSQEIIGLSEARGRLEQTQAEARNVGTGARPAEIRALQAQLAEAKARLIEATSERDRVLPLVRRGIETQSSADRVEANFKAAAARVAATRESIAVARLPGRSALREAASAAISAASAATAAAQWRLDERTVKAKVGGRIEQRFHYPGEFVVAGAPVVALLPETGIKIRFFVPETTLAKLELGKTVRVRADGLEGAVVASVSFISSDAEFTPPVIYSRESRRKLVFMVEARPSAPSQLRPGLPVEVEWQ